MRDLTTWKNEQFKRMKAEMDRLFREFSRDFGTSVFDEIRGEAPFVDISETEDSVVVTMRFPEIDPADIDISVSPEAIIIEGGKKERRVSAGRRIESSRQFSNRLRLPCRVQPEKVEAVYRANRLEILLPKARSAVFKKIPVRRDEK